MKTLIFTGTPRKNGDTMALVKEFIDNLDGEYKIVEAYDCDIKPCIDCRFCWENDGCSIRDGMDEIYEYIQECDNVLIASPIYFSQLTGQLLAVTSRLQTYFCSRFFRKENPILKKKKGGVILVGGGDGSPKSAYESARVILHHMNSKDEGILVCSHNTNNVPAKDDVAAIMGVREVAEFFNNK